MLLIGLTGSLATGKSTVSNILRSPPHNLPIIDADVLAREAVEPGTSGYRRIVAYFGPTTPDLLLPYPDDGAEGNDGSTDEQEANRQQTARPRRRRRRRGRPLNRAALGRRVFGSSPSRVRDRRYLNGIVHPRVRLAIAKLVLWHWITGSWAVVLDIPLLYDSALDIFTPAVVMIAASPATQMSRLRGRDRHLSEQEAQDRVGSQGGVGEKVDRTEARGEGRGWVVWNDGGMGELEKRVGEVMGEVGRGRRMAGWGGWMWLVGWPVAVGWGMWEVWRGWKGRRAWERRKEEGKKSD
ncbi:MAG: hypothetical protein Q9202_000342 [Teloschistes flavicans]